MVTLRGYVGWIRWVTKAALIEVIIGWGEAPAVQHLILARQGAEHEHRPNRQQVGVVRPAPRGELHRVNGVLDVDLVEREHAEPGAHPPVRAHLEVETDG